MGNDAAEEKQPWACCLLTGILIAYIREQAKGKDGLDYARLFQDAEGLEVPANPEAFLRDDNNWVPVRVLREVLHQGEVLTGQKDFAYHAARSYFRPGRASVPSLFSIILRVLNDPRAVLICANLFGAVQTNYLRLQAFERPGARPDLYLLAQFDKGARGGVRSMYFLRGVVEGFAQLYPFIDEAQCLEEVSQLRLEDIVEDFPEYVSEREGDRLVIRRRGSPAAVVEARRVPLRRETLPLTPEFEVNLPDLAVVLPQGGRIKVLTQDEETDREVGGDAVWAYKVVQGGRLTHGPLGYPVPAGQVYNAPYCRLRYELREGRRQAAPPGHDVRAEVSQFLFDHLGQIKQTHMRMVQHHIEKRNLTLENLRLRREIDREYSFAGIVGRSERMRDLFNVVRAVAETDVTALIQGETGTGKELIARAIHHHSARRAKRFEAINCGALSETLLESELFGHEKGAFTGAVGQRKGIFEVADGGTLFLDEIGEVAPATQVKLLRVLQDGELRRVGGTESIHADVRIVAATNQDLQDMVKAGRFREDLYYRLKVFPMTVPPLRERREDIPHLVPHFLAKHAERLQRPVGGISGEAMALLMAFSWPGNVRELENVILRMLVVCKGDTLDVTDVPEELRGTARGPEVKPGDLKEIARGTTEMVERRAILEALEKGNWNVTRTAQALGISRAGLQNKMKAYGLRRPGRSGGGGARGD